MTKDGANRPLPSADGAFVPDGLIKCFEDRAVFPPGHFGRFHAGSRSFRDILRHGSVEECCDCCGILRTNSTATFSRWVRMAALAKSDLQIFADLVDANTLGHQKYFWELFSFYRLFR